MHSIYRGFLSVLYILALLSVASCRISYSNSLNEELGKLDNALEAAEEYVHAKEQKISTIENMLNSRGVNDLQKYHIYGQLFDEYEAYQFDKAKEMLEHQESVAESLNNLSLKNDALLDKAMLYINAGLYLETYEIFEQLDTTSFDRQQMVAWPLWRSISISSFIIASFSMYISLPGIYASG